MSRYPKIDLDGALVAITGAARGIGLATAKAFVAAGAQVALGDLDDALAKEAAAELGASASGHRLDVTRQGVVRRFPRRRRGAARPPVDVLVNNAGVMPNGPFLDQEDRIDRLTMDVNVYGVIHGMRLVLPGMIERGQGHVVNVASLAGKFPIKGLAVYNASKYAVVGLTAATRLELEGTGVSLTRGAAERGPHRAVVRHRLRPAAGRRPGGHRGGRREVGPEPARRGRRAVVRRAGAPSRAAGA